MGDERLIQVGALARVEGEGAVHVTIDGDHVTDVQLRIYEPPRFFEAFLRGRAYTEPPDLTARICGICPVAYQMSACAAIEAACGVEVDEALAGLRRLLYCGEWIESHALHIYFLHAPDFLGYDSGLALAKDHPALVEQGLELKATGNALVELLGGRPVHPVNVRVGGFYRVPEPAETAALRGRLERARDLAVATVEWVGGFDVPDVTGDWELVALRHPGEYPITRGRMVSTSGLDVAPEQFEEHVVEVQRAHSTALHAQLASGQRYLVGPLARFALNADRLGPTARAAAAAAGLDAGNRNPYRSIVVRAVEVVQACDEALAMVTDYERPERAAVPVEPRAGVGCGWTEAPRGLLWHRYELDGAGLVRAARIVPPTSQNQDAIEHDVWQVLDAVTALPDAELAHRAGHAIRNHDPCISCATHAVELRRRGGEGS